MTAHSLKRSSPSAARNRVPIGDVIKDLLPTEAKVLEVASGTGEHGAYFTGLRPDISWQYSDIDPEGRTSQAAYAQDNADQLLMPLDLDVTSAHWWQDCEGITAIYCANMIHIAPWAAAQGLVKGASELLSTGEFLILYGPYFEGENTAQSNKDFDINLKMRNPTWGVRELAVVQDLCAQHTLILKSKTKMPRDNLLLVFEKG